jgi:hypothetical protein
LVVFEEVAAISVTAASPQLMRITRTHGDARDTGHRSNFLAAMGKLEAVVGFEEQNLRGSPEDVARA